MQLDMDMALHRCDWDGQQSTSIQTECS